MYCTMRYQWPGWRNIKRDDTGKAASVNLDMVGHNCVVWRYLATEQGVESVRIPQTDGNYTLPSETSYISGDVFTEYDIDYFNNTTVERERLQITINRANENRLCTMTHHLDLDQDPPRPHSAWRRKWNQFAELFCCLRRPTDMRF